MTPDEEERMIVQHMGFAAHLARRYNKPGTQRYDEALQDTVLEMWRALKTYDPSRGSFKTYAKAWIIRGLLRRITHRYSLPGGIGGGERTGKLVRNGTILNERTRIVHADAGIVALEDRETIDAAMSHLEPRERMVFDRVYRDEWRLEDIAIHIGVCRERTRQIKESALKKLRQAIRVSQSATWLPPQYPTQRTPGNPELIARVREWQAYGKRTRAESAKRRRAVA